jgi:hypothetical protein
MNIYFLTFFFLLLDSTSEKTASVEKCKLEGGNSAHVY